jgi:hypothetical protein
MQIAVNMPIESQTLMRNILDADRERLKHAAAQFIAGHRLNADRPEARSALGNFYARRGGYRGRNARLRSG